MHRLCPNYVHDARTENYQLAARLGLTAQDLLVLSTLDHVRRHYLEDALAAIPLPLWELGKMTDLSPAQLKTCMRHLVDARLIYRRQTLRAKGSPAETVLLPMADVVLGRAEAYEHIGDIPADLAGLLAWESPSTVSAVCAAWAAGEMPPVDVERSWLSGAESWSRVVGVLHKRMESVHDVLLESAARADRAAAVEARGDAEIPLSDGGTYVIDGATLSRLAPDMDARHVREVLLRVMTRGVRVTSGNVARLAAEAAYSRARGFVAAKPWRDSVQILAAVMSSGRWNTPRGIGSDDYAAFVRAGRAGGLSTAELSGAHN